MRALPEFRAWRPRASTLGSAPVGYWLRLGAERVSGLLPGRAILHPYWATAVGPRAAISILDLALLDSVHPVNRAMLRRAARGAGVLIGISRATSAEVANRFDRQVHLVSPFPEPDFFTPPTMAEPAGRSGRLRLGYWGGWHERKQIIPFARALAASPWASHVELHVVGEVPADLGPLPVVSRPPGPIAELVAWVDDIDVAVYPSGWEGFGLPVFEALLRDRPVIAQPLPCYADFVANPARLCQLPDPGDPAAVAAALDEAVRPRPAGWWRQRLSHPDLEGCLWQTRRQALTAIAALH